MRKVIFIAGEICSGKDTMMANKYQGIQYKQIDLGTLVRQKFQTEERIFDNNLEEYFIEKIKEIRAIDDDVFGKNFITYVITGLRQPSLAKKICAIFDQVEFNYLVAPRHILKQRYFDRGADKDKKISFEDAIAGDQSLGMKELQVYLLTEVECNFIKSY